MLQLNAGRDSSSKGELVCQTGLRALSGTATQSA